MNEEAKTEKSKKIMVGVAIGTCGSRALMIKRRDDAQNLAGKWVFPGGKAEDGDKGDICRTAEREAYEETGVKMSAIKILFRCKRTFDTDPGVEYEAVYVHCVADDKTTGDGEGLETKRVSFHELSAMCAKDEAADDVIDNLTRISSVFADPHEGEKRKSDTLAQEEREAAEKKLAETEKKLKEAEERAAEAEAKAKEAEERTAAAEEKAATTEEE